MFSRTLRRAPHSLEAGVLLALLIATVCACDDDPFGGVCYNGVIVDFVDLDETPVDAGEYRLRATIRDSDGVEVSCSALSEQGSWYYRQCQRTVDTRPKSATFDRRVDSSTLTSFLSVEFDSVEWQGEGEYSEFDYRPYKDCRLARVQLVLSRKASTTDPP